MRFVVIGGRGFIGSFVWRPLSDRGHEVVVVARDYALKGLECDAAIHMFAMTQAGGDRLVRDFRERASRLAAANSGDVYRA